MNGRYLYCIAFLLLAGTPATAQYSEAAFEQKQAGELYDERGFMHGKAITVDGKLVVSNSNGNVSYSYPLSSWKEKGYGMGLTLNYCGSVAFTTFGEYTEESMISPYAQWNKFTQNRPVWLVGFNGFAVQSLSFANAFHADPDWVDAYEDVYTTSYDDDDFLWVIDGYDFCNRMQDFAHGSYEEAQGSTPYRYRDVIRLLRSDGSVLELMNIKHLAGAVTTSSTWSQTEHLYSGHYVVNEANAQGYAYVEYQQNVDLPDYLEEFLENEPRFQPRIVHYYPGDGLEYIFSERFNPYGMADLRDGYVHFGGVRANPTIFYLSEVRMAGERLVQLNYSRHGELYDYSTAFSYVKLSDSTKGRALLTGVGDATFSYGDGWMVVKDEGRATTVRFDTIAYSGNAVSSEVFPLATLGYLTAEAEAVATFDLEEAGQYKSWIGYVTRITDPEDRETTFDYETYERRHYGFGFPKAAATVTLDNYRLSEVVEPTTQYALTYHNRGGGTTIDVAGLDTLTVTQGSVGDYPYAFSNAADSIEKRTLGVGGVLLTTDYYDFVFGTSLVGTTPTGAVVSTKDHISGRTTVTSYEYSRHLLPHALYLSPDKYYTALNKVETSGYVNGVKTDSTGQYTTYTNPAPYLWLPLVANSTSNNAAQGRQYYTYELDTIRRFGEEDTLIKYFGLGLSKKTTYIQDPLERNHTLTVTDYLNIMEFDTTFTTIQARIDKFAMHHNFFKYRDTLHDPDFEHRTFAEVFYDPRILVVTGYDTITLGDYKIPPFFGLVEETRTTTANGDYLAGKRNVYCLVGDCDGGPETITGLLQLGMAGALLSDTLFGRDRRTLSSNAIGYANFDRGMPDYTINGLGAKGRNYYGYRHPGIPSTSYPTGMMLANDDLTYSQTLKDGSSTAYRYEIPQSQRVEVRRYDPLLTLKIDTLTTMNELSRFGQVTASVDPNGWLSEYSYDYNGRLTYAWLPYDFQSPDSTYFVDFHGLEEITGYGGSAWIDHYDTTDCTPNNGWVAGSYSVPLGGSEHLFIDHPTVNEPPCGGFGSRADEKGASSQTFGGVDQPFQWRDSSTGYLSFMLPSAYGHDIINIDSAFVELYASTVIGSCVTVNMWMPDHPTFSKTWLLNCDALAYDPGGGGTGSGTTGGEVGKGMRTMSDPDTVNGQFLLRVNLVDFLDTIENDDVLRFILTTTTVNGRVDFINGYESESNYRPLLKLYVHTLKRNTLSDYTLHYEYDDEGLTSTVIAKVDDSLHTSNQGVGGIAMLGEARRMSTTNYFGADYRLLKSKTPIGPMDSPVRYDSVLAHYDGLGMVLKARDQLNDTVTTAYDGAGRADTTWNQDGTFTHVEYYTCTYDPNPNPELPQVYPTSCFDFVPSEQDFYGSVSVKVVTNELGKKFAQYYDAFGQLRREIADSGGLHRVTKYEYDMLGRVKRVTNPAGDETEYWYDDFGRVLYKSQPDLGTISYAYDKLGNVRFVQTQEQEYEDRITFNEYDDLNRVVIVGEADFFDHQTGIDAPRSPLPGSPSPVTGDREKSSYSKTVQSVPTDDTLNLNRITDQLDPNILHDDSLSAFLTANYTLWVPPNSYAKTIPSFWSDLDSIPETCEDMNMAVPDAIGPFLKHEANVYEPTAEISDYDDFENLAKHPENVRIAIHYDTLPYHAGAVWYHFPTKAEWDSLAPHGKVRNLKGREAAVAYREHGGEPYHFSVISYDERGRPEALLRYTENLGFDAIYYAYNSMNQLIAVTVADPYRQFATWYGYDDNGRVDSVWTKLSEAGHGLKGYNGSQAKYPTVAMSRPQSAEITYVYTKTGQVDSMFYPAVSVAVDYRYSPRKWLDTLKATKGGSDLFTQYLTFNAGGQITRQQSQQGGSYPLIQDYTYDGISQLTEWKKQYGGIYGWTRELYAYDPVGNRDSLTYIANGWSTPYPKDYYDNGRGSSVPGVGPNQLLKVTQPSGDYTEYDYDRNGSMTTRQQYTSTNVLTKEERFGYSSWRNLPWSYEREDPTITVGPNVWEYRYRYNAMGEREQKREWLTPAGDVTAPGYEWTYYLLGGSKEQMSVWKGMQTSESGFCGDTGTGSNVYLYPVEYLSYGGYAASLIARPSGTVEYRISDHLGSNRVVLDNTGTVLSTTDYAPFGKPVAGSEDRKNWIDKETDAENDLGNLGVRAYDDNLGRFTSVDPIWEKFAFMNPYHYSHNSPVIRVDPNGLDDYKIDNVTGKITLIPDTEDKNQDRLFAVDDKGEIEQDNVLILKKGILSKGVKGVDKYGHEFVYYVIKGDDAATKFFEFVAKNSHVEWSQTLLGKAGKNGKNYIATAFDEFQEWGGRHLMQEQFADGWTIREHRHSHPNNTPRPSGSATSVDLYGDIGFARWVKAYADGSSKTVFKIYLPAHEIYMWYKKDGEYEHVKLEDKKE
ncbi:MAG: hypothetical protein H6616_15005 [Ignavibacteria bacterium]|nr:hypothetical protein [Ignavibacteria bacterium]